MSPRPDYLLGVNPTELDRLKFQHSVWGPVTNRFFDRLGIQERWKCLDVGAGPGFVTFDLLQRIGTFGEVTLLEPSQYYLEYFREEAGQRGISNVGILCGTAEEADLPERHYDFIFARWVIAFVPDAEKFFRKLAGALRPGGIIALQDYWYEGLSLYPRGGAFDTMADAVRKYYRSVGGNPYITGDIPVFFKKFGLRTIDFTPTQLAGGPTSPVMEWGHRFFTVHIPIMAEKGIITKEQSEDLVADWIAHRRNPDAVYFSPIVVDVAGRKDL